MGIHFENLDDVYTTPNFEIKKGSRLFLCMHLEGNLKDFDSSPLGTKQILRIWGYYVPSGKTIRPFTLLDFTSNENENRFKAELKCVKKDKNVDELKLLIKDLIDLYNIEGINVKKCEVTFS